MYVPYLPKSMGFGNVAAFAGTISPYASDRTKALTANQGVVKPTWSAELLLGDVVDANELSVLLNSEGTTTYNWTRKNTWAYWNVNYCVDGAVHASDLSVLLNVYGKPRTGEL